jgi:acyl-CoA thioester hydrolase
MQLPPLDPARAITHSTFRARFCETDLMGIVHHGQYLTYFEAGRVDWLRRRGITYTSWTARDIHLPVVEATLRYRAPARFDDVLTVETRLVELRWASLRYEYAVRREGAVLAEGMTRLACVDGAHVLRRIPVDVLSVLAAGELPSPSGEITV